MRFEEWCSSLRKRILRLEKIRKLIKSPDELNNFMHEISIRSLFSLEIDFTLFWFLNDVFFRILPQNSENEIDILLILKKNYRNDA